MHRAAGMSTPADANTLHDKHGDQDAQRVSRRHRVSPDLGPDFATAGQADLHAEWRRDAVKPSSETRLRSWFTPDIRTIAEPSRVELVRGCCPGSLHSGGLANGRDVRTLVAQRGEPLLLHATTSPNWTAELHRHRPERDDCPRCRIPEDAVTDFDCSTGPETPEEPTSPKAV
jgi:hypothetical protein